MAYILSLDDDDDANVKNEFFMEKDYNEFSINNNSADIDTAAANDYIMLFKNVCRTKNRIITQAKYKKKESCAICLESMFNKRVLHTPCNHLFHYRCITTFYNSNQKTKYNCPLCRANNYSALKPFGYTPYINIYDEDELFNNELMISVNYILYNEDHYNDIITNEATLLIGTFAHIICQTFSPVCFRSIISTYPIIDLNEPATICPICISNFITYLYSSSSSENQINSFTLYIIQQSFINSPTIVYHIKDMLLDLLQFNTLQEVMSFIYPEI